MAFHAFAWNGSGHLHPMPCGGGAAAGWRPVAPPGRRCGPFDVALKLLSPSTPPPSAPPAPFPTPSSSSASAAPLPSGPAAAEQAAAAAVAAPGGGALLRALLGRLVSAELPLERGEEALRLAATKGTLKVQLVMPPA